MADDAARHRQRLATLAGLAKPVQHDINNLLTVVFANLELLKRTAAEGGPQRQLDRVAQATKRLEASCRAILSLNRRPVPGPETLPLVEALRALEPLFAVLLPTPPALRLEGEGWRVTLDRAALDEALLLLAHEAAGGPRRGAGLVLDIAEVPGPPDLVELRATWPEANPPPSEALRAALAAAGKVSGEGHALRLAWPRAPD